MKRSETLPVPFHHCRDAGRDHHPDCAKSRCVSCYRHHQSYWSKTFSIRHPGETEAHIRWRKEHPRRKDGCMSCGRPRKFRMWYCDKCREEWHRATHIRKWRKENERKRLANLAKGIARPNRWKIPASPLKVRREAA